MPPFGIDVDTWSQFMCCGVPIIVCCFMWAVMVFNEGRRKSQGLPPVED